MRRIAIVALARRLAIALSSYLVDTLIPEGRGSNPSKGGHWAENSLSADSAFSSGNCMPISRNIDNAVVN